MLESHILLCVWGGHSLTLNGCMRRSRKIHIIFAQIGKHVLQWKLKLNSPLAIAETQHLNCCLLNVVL